VTRKVIKHRITDKEKNFAYRESLKYYQKPWAVAGAECNTVIEVKLEHHAA